MSYIFDLRSHLSYITEHRQLEVKLHIHDHAGFSQNSTPPLLPRGIWEHSGGILDFMRTLYQNILDRDPESQSAIDGWTQCTSSDGLATAIAGIFTSPEYTSRQLSTEASVEKFYLAVLGRLSDEGGKANWIGAVRGGMSLLTVAKGFVGSEEYRRKVQAGEAPHPIHWP